jgi:MFS family permease
LGRRSIFTFSLLWYSICTLIMAFQTTAMSIVIWRFIASIGIGVELVNIDTYISELVPQKIRAGLSPSTSSSSPIRSDRWSAWPSPTDSNKWQIAWTASAIAVFG